MSENELNENGVSPNINNVNRLEEKLRAQMKTVMEQLTEENQIIDKIAMGGGNERFHCVIDNIA